MGRYVGPKCKVCRREGVKLFLRGDRCYTGKCPIGRRPQAPGQHGRFRRRATPYALRIREKQKLKRIYGVREAQFRRYVEAAKKWKGVTGEALLKFLERRLDNVVYRTGFAPSRDQARQLVSHGHFAVNGRPTNIPSYLVREGDIVEVKAESRDKLRELVKAAAERRPVPSWLTRDLEGLRIQVAAEPNLEELDQSIDTSLIVEFYSR
ncbi:MAG: 30S ribosomal protein S4 [Candidatus Acetothermia bacterium]|nr:30S ribosomal protein S4 [Candidatus Bipolaricaulota bacterium]MCR4392164.1 30S ribosomal protein S4 [Candidatus Acetothermia bacterium]